MYYEPSIIYFRQEDLNPYKNLLNRNQNPPQARSTKYKCGLLNKALHCYTMNIKQRFTLGKSPGSRTGPGW